MLDDIRQDAKWIVSSGDVDTINLPCVFNDGVNPDINSFGNFIRRTDTLEYDDGNKKKAPYSSLTTDIDIFNFAEKYISLKDWTVTVEGNTYIIEQSNPNRTLGIIQMDLKDG